MAFDVVRILDHELISISLAWYAAWLRVYALHKYMPNGGQWPASSTVCPPFPAKLESDAARFYNQVDVVDSSFTVPPLVNVTVLLPKRLNLSDGGSTHCTLTRLLRGHGDCGI